MDFFNEFPTMDRLELRDLKKAIDLGFRDFSRAYGDALESFFEPLLRFLVWFEKLLVDTPWPVIILVIAALVFLGSRSWMVVTGTVVSFLVIGYFGMWEDTMATLAIISVASLLCIAFGIPLGIVMARSNRVQSIITPVLDVMQTIPSFVYLIPVVMLLGIGKVPGLLAVCIYAMPPVVRLTNLGIRLVDKEVLEAADAFGASYREKTVQCSDSTGVTQYFCRCEPDHHDGPGDGGGCFDDWGEGIGHAGAARNFQPISGAGVDEWSGNCGTGHHFRSSLSKIWQTLAKAPGRRTRCLRSKSASRIYTRYSV